MKISRTLYVSTLFLSMLIIGSEVGNAEKVAEYKSNGLVKFIPGLDQTNPTDPTDPENPHTLKPTDPSKPGTSGPLSIDFVSSFDFGLNEITNKDIVYFANAQQLSNSHTTKWVPNFVQVTDSRGTNSGWTLTVKQQGQLANKNANNKELVGAQIALIGSRPNGVSNDTGKPQTMDATLDPAGSESVIMVSNNGAGAGTWVSLWGEVSFTENGKKNSKKPKNTGVLLSIPGSTPKDAVTYTTKLIWTLKDVPSIL